MNKPFKIYYNTTGFIKTITKENLEGNFVTIEDDQYEEVVNNISKYQIENGKLQKIKKIKHNPITIKFCNDFDLGKSNYCYIVEKNNLFCCEQSVKIKPKDFDDTKYSWVKYDS